MYENYIAERIASLRNKKNISAREMSLSLGQNSSYINRIENKLAFPSMTLFFYICEYLNITPRDFFDETNPNPEKINEITEELKKLNDQQLEIILDLVKSMQSK